MNANWQVHVLGGLSVHGPGVIVSHFRSQRGAALLGYLALHRGRPVPREALAELLWPESEPEVGRANLRVELTGLRRVFAAPGAAGAPALLADHATVFLDSRVVGTDAAAFERALARARAAEGTEADLDALREAVERYGGALLPALYDDWIQPERDRLAAHFVAAADRLSEVLAYKGDLDGAIEIAHRALATDPLREEAHARLVRLYATTGHADAARSRARALLKLLREELECEPSAETHALLRGLGFDEPNAAAPLPAPTRPRLPAARTRFFGREEELALLQAWLRPGALVTLTGIGGVGKTRLALEAAARLASGFGGAVWFAPLADVRHADAIAHAVASALQLPHDPATPPLPQVASALAERPALLVLDNLEHLLDDASHGDAASIVRDLMDAAPQLAVLATSRRRLGLEGEQELPVSPLSSSAPAPIATTDAVSLFADRARLVRPSFMLSDEAVAAVADICDCVDGIPLAIELAATWMQTLTPAQVRDRLRAGSGRVELLVSRDRTRPARHRSLATALRWGYDLLPPRAQQTLTCLAACAGSFDLEAAAVACGVPDALEDLTTLRERSLLLAEEHETGMRYRLLETVREFALRLLPAETRAEVEARLAGLYLARVERLDRELRGPGSASAMAQLAADDAGIEQALATLYGRAEALQLAAPLVAYWARRGRLEDGRRWLRRALDGAPDAPPPARAAALFADAALLAFQGEANRAAETAAQAADLLEDLDDEQAARALCPLANPHLLLNFGGVRPVVLRLFARTERLPELPVQAFLFAAMAQQIQYGGEYARAAELQERAISLYRRLGDEAGVAAVLCQCSNSAMLRGDYAAAESSWEEALASYGRLEDAVGAADVLGGLGYVARLTGRYDRARALAEEALDIGRRLGLRSTVATATWAVGTVALRTGDYEEAACALQQAVCLHREIGSVSSLADCLAAQGALALCLGDFEAARQRHAEALALREQANDRLDLAHSRSALAGVALMRGDFEEAARGYGAALALAEEMQSGYAIANGRVGLGLCAARTGDLADAAEHVTAGLDLLRAVPDPQYRALGLEALAEVRQLQDRAAEAARALGAAEALRASTCTPLPPSARPHLAELAAAIRAALGAPGFDAAREQGRTLPPEQAIARLLEAVSIACDG